MRASRVGPSLASRASNDSLSSRVRRMIVLIYVGDGGLGEGMLRQQREARPIEAEWLPGLSSQLSIEAQGAAAPAGPLPTPFETEPRAAASGAHGSACHGP